MKSKEEGYVYGLIMGRKEAYETCLKEAKSLTDEDWRYIIRFIEKEIEKLG